MKRLVILLVVNLGLSGGLQAASSAKTALPIPTPVNPVVSSKVVAPSAPVTAVTTPSTVGTEQNSPSEPIDVQMSNQKAQTNLVMSNLSASGVAVLVNNAQITSDVMNSIQKQAAASPQIDDATTLQSYLDQVSNFSTSGQSSLQALATAYKNKINVALSDGNSKIMNLAGQNIVNQNLAATLSSDLTAQSTFYEGQIDSTLSTQAALINNLLTIVEANINNAHTSAEKSSGGSSWEKDALDMILAGIKDIAVPAAAGLAAYYGKQILCKFNIGVCPPVDSETEALIKKFKLPGNIDELLKKVGCSKVTELLDRSATTLEAVKSQLAENLKLAPDKLNELITKAGKSAGASDEDIAGFLKKVGSIQDQLEAKFPSLSAESIMQKIGSKLSEVTGQEIDVKDIVSRIQMELTTAKSLPLEPSLPVIPSGQNEQPIGSSGSQISAGGSGESNLGANFFKQLQAVASSSKMNLKTNMIEQIRDQGLTLQEFQAQTQALQQEMQELSGEARIAAQEQLDTAKELIDANKSVEGPVEEPIFVE